MQYFRLLDDINFPNRWHLGGLIGIDSMEFVRPPRVPLYHPLREQIYGVDLQVKGAPMDYTTTSFRSVPIASSEAVQALLGLKGFTSFPVRIPEFQEKTSYCILHFWDVADCFDEASSDFEVIPMDDPIRPDLAGNYRSVTKLRVDAARADGKDIFRIARLEGHTIVSNEVKQRFETAGVTGAVFECVTAE